MQFAKQVKDLNLSIQNNKNRVVVFLHNLIWWLPLFLVLLKVVDHRSGTILFFILTTTRAIINVYRNNFMKLEDAIHFPFRGPETYK